MDTASSSGAAGLPVACTLGPDDGAQRRRRWEALSAKGRPNARIRGHVLVVRYQRELGVREELEALAAAERRCCSFVTWTVSQDDDSVVLNVVADPGRPDDIAAIAALFQAP
jgi:hypothetical protein